MEIAFSISNTSVDANTLQRQARLSFDSVLIRAAFVLMIKMCWVGIGMPVGYRTAPHGRGGCEWVGYWIGSSPHRNTLLVCAVYNRSIEGS